MINQIKLHFYQIKSSPAQKTATQSNPPGLFFLLFPPLNKYQDESKEQEQQI